MSDKIDKSNGEGCIGCSTEKGKTCQNCVYRYKMSEGAEQILSDALSETKTALSQGVWDIGRKPKQYRKPNTFAEVHAARIAEGPSSVVPKNQPLSMKDRMNISECIGDIEGEKLDHAAAQKQDDVLFRTLTLKDMPVTFDSEFQRNREIAAIITEGYFDGTS